MLFDIQLMTGSSAAVVRSLQSAVRSYMLLAWQLNSWGKGGRMGA